MNSPLLSPPHTPNPSPGLEKQTHNVNKSHSIYAEKSYLGFCDTKVCFCAQLSAAENTRASPETLALPLSNQSLPVGRQPKWTSYAASQTSAKGKAQPSLTQGSSATRHFSSIAPVSRADPERQSAWPKLTVKLADGEQTPSWSNEHAVATGMLSAVRSVQVLTTVLGRKKRRVCASPAVEDPMNAATRPLPAMQHEL